MKIELHKIKLSDIFDGYQDNQLNGVVGFSGKLDIRPKYQREFIYKDKQRNSVIETVMKCFPLNVIYWVKSESKYEVLDGQQRTISVCEYISGNFSVGSMYFHNLPQDQQKKILDYEMMVYICEGSESEKLDWFKTINIAGEKLTDQELRNATYTGSWLTSAKEHFSKPNCVANQKGGHFLSGSSIRQEYLETVLKWISNDSITSYMAKHQKDKDADELWQYFIDVINWVEKLFPAFKNYEKEMKGVEWGLLFNQHKGDKFNITQLQKDIDSYMADDEVGSKSGVFPYLITKKEKFLNLRTFSDKIKREVFEKQKDCKTGKAICKACKDLFTFTEMEGDHITPWHAGGKTTTENCQMLCKSCNRTKSGS